MEKRADSELKQAREALEKAKAEKDSEGVRDAKKWIALEEHTETLVDGANVVVSPRRGERFKGERGKIVRRDSANIFLVHTPQLDMLVDGRDLKLSRKGG